MSIDSGTIGRGARVLVATAAAWLLAAPAASAEELLSAPATADRQTTGSCTARPLDSAWSERVTVPALSNLTATLRGGEGDWDLAVLSARSGETIAGSAYSGAEEVAGGYAFEGERLIVQACRMAGASGSPTVELSIDPIDREKAGPAPALLRVQTPDDDAVAALENSDLDVTHNVGPGFLDVIAYGPGDRRTLAQLGLSYVTRVGDLTRESASFRQAEESRRAPGGLPSGRTGTYRRLFDYSEEMKALERRNPRLVRTITLREKTYEGRPVEGIEITRNVNARDGKPIFLQLGVHHAREWPSGEHALEWAYELIRGHKADRKRPSRLLRQTRTIIVPVVNPDGFNASREAGELQGAAGGRGGSADQELINIVTHPNEYRRKNCRFADDRPDGDCAQPSVGIAGAGVDPNRNYGGFWGGPGASTDPTAPDYRGPGPFSEPETRNIQRLASRNQITAFITNHTFSNLVLRPPGLASEGPPVDEGILKRLGRRMAAENGYTNQPAFGLYDTTGSTEDWAYYATGALGYTFEIGPRNFHPPYAEMVAEWRGTTAAAGDGGGNRAAYYALHRFAAKKKSHSLIKGRAPKRGEVILKKTFMTPTSPVIDETGSEGDVQRFRDRLRSSVKVKRSGRFRFHINPSTRPLVAASKGRKPKGPPSDPQRFEGGVDAGLPPAPQPCADADTEDPACWNDHPFRVPNERGRDNDSAIVRVEWPSEASDWDMKVFRDSDGDRTSEGETKPVGTSAAGPSAFEQVTIGPADLVEGGRYVVRMVNFAAFEPYEGIVRFDGPPKRSEGKRERWTIVCKNRRGRKTGSRKLFIERGEMKRLDLRKGC